MNLNPPRPIRALLYLSAMFGTPTVSYFAATDKISDALTVLLTSYIALVMGLAAANTAGEPPTA